MSDKPSAQTERALTKGMAAEAKLDRWTALEIYGQALETSPDDPSLSFRRAYNLDLVGEEEQTLLLYEKACRAPRPALNALINLAICYEDAGEYAKAERCLKTVLDTDPNHARGRLYMKDVQASRRLEDLQVDAGLNEKLATLMEVPLTDFELAAPTRLGLKAQNLRTVGDLLRVSETDLVASKNLDEAAMAELRSILEQRGLRIGQLLEDQKNADREAVYNRLKGSTAEAAIELINKPVDDLNLSIRARKALEVLGIATIGDLVARTEAELLGVKNFGATSLGEITERLSRLGLALRTLE